MRTFWMMFAMVATAAAACNEHDGTSVACAGSSGGGAHPASAGTEHADESFGPLRPARGAGRGMSQRVVYV